jgi:hypothetical protein
LGKRRAEGGAGSERAARRNRRNGTTDYTDYTDKKDVSTQRRENLLGNLRRQWAREEEEKTFARRCRWTQMEDSSVSYLRESA